MEDISAQITTDQAPTTPAKKNEATSMTDFIKQQFVNSWNRLRLHLVSIISINLIIIAIVFGMMVILGGVLFSSIVSIAGDVNQIRSFNWEQYFISHPQQAAYGALIILVIVLASSVVISAFSYAQTSILAESKKQKLKAHLKKGFSLIIPLIGISLISSFFVFGGFFVVFIPGVLMAIFLSYTPQQAIIHNKRGMDALKGSYTIISQNFARIFVAALCLGIVESIATNFLPNLFEQAGSIGQTILAFYGPIMSLLVGWFSFAYGIELYLYAEKRTDWKKDQNITWMWIISVLGWAIIVVGSYFVIQNLPSLSQEIINSIESSTNQENPFANLPPLNEN